MNWNRKKVLVAGGASFIGSHLTERLLQRGASVRISDDFSSGSLNNLLHVSDRIEFLEGDLRDWSFAASVMKDVDIVFQLAAFHGGRGYIDTHPVECSSNMILDGIVFKSAFEAGVDKICYASSACVYPTTLQSRNQSDPSNRNILLNEEMADPFIVGKALADKEYGWAKLMGETVLRAYYREYGLKSAICRIFTSYGERENETHAIMALIAKAFVERTPYIVWGTGEQDRNFTYVGDTADGMIRAAEVIEDGTPVNIGRSEHIKIKDAVKKILEITGFAPTHIVYDASKPQGVFSRAADLTRARQLLNWEPKISFDEGLKRTISWYYTTKNKDEVSRKLDVLLMER